MQVDSRFSRYRSNIIQTKSAIQIPSETDIETANSTYNNGIFEITFKKDDKGRVVEAKVKTIKVGLSVVLNAMTRDQYGKTYTFSVM